MPSMWVQVRDCQLGCCSSSSGCGNSGGGSSGGREDAQPSAGTTRLAAVDSCRAACVGRCDSTFLCPNACAAASTLPDVLVKKLAPGGRMVIPVGSQWDYQVSEEQG